MSTATTIKQTSDMRIKNVDIDLRQTKYRLPAIMYIPVFIVGCLIINIFWSPEDGKAETKNTGIDTNVPEANVDSILGGRDADAVDYGDAVNAKIRERYSESQEFAVLRQKEEKPDEYQEYFAYCEACKDFVKTKKAGAV